MHPRNLHKSGYDFNILVSQNPNLEHFIISNKLGRPSINFSDENAVLELNKSLIITHYNVANWAIPAGHLCPSVPGRSEYIHHLADLLGIQTDKRISIFDIGTGAGMVYPILGNSLYQWHFTGSEINKESYQNCFKILETNSELQSQIEIRIQDDRNKIFENIINENDYFQAAMCNPPFFNDENAALKATNRKWNNLNLKNKINHRNFEGVRSELTYPGGEISFINNIISESLKYKKNFGWITTLVSNQRNLKALQNRLSKEKVKQIKVIDMSIGQKTSRILAWKLT